MKIKYEYVKSMRLAGYLMQQGFRILKITQNTQFQDKDVYVFEQSKELSNCILEYIRTKEKKDGNYKQDCNSKSKRNNNKLL